MTEEEADKFTVFAYERHWRILDRGGIMRSLARRLKSELTANNQFHYSLYADYITDRDKYTGAVYKEFTKQLFPMLMSAGGAEHHILPGPSASPTPSTGSVWSCKCNSG